MSAFRVKVKKQHVALLIVCVVVSAAFLTYFLAGHAVSGSDTLVMPLDDTYIHFQYARMIAQGQPFRYQLGDPYTSGATSLIYPFILAAGYLIGFQGMSLSLWAVGIGLLCWIGSAGLVFLIVQRGDSSDQKPVVIPFIVAVAFALTGSLAFAFMSGMETGLFVFLTLMTLYQTLRGDLRGMLIAGTLATLTRPEGTVIAVGACAYFVFTKKVARRQWPLLLIPVVAAVIQPLINLALTGTITASGMQSKALLYLVPANLGRTLGEIFKYFIFALRELITGDHADSPTRTLLYTAPILGMLSIAYLVIRLRPQLARQRQAPPISILLLICVWLLGLAATVSLLETSFWQFKRYHQSMIALIYVMAGWALIALWKKHNWRWLSLGAALIMLLYSGVTLRDFWQNFRDNVHEVVFNQLAMAHYVTVTAPPDARIGVHDVGVMAYAGNRKTYDLPGLSIPGAALAWRNGPGAMYEAIAHSPYRPEYFAIYPDHHGLAYFAQAGLFSPTLAEFPSSKPVNNVATASDLQIVSKPDWSLTAAASGTMQASSGRASTGMTLRESLNVADLQDEAQFHYQWQDRVQNPGYATELYRQNTLNCVDPAACLAIDGGRLITGSESFTVNTTPGQDLLWITRVHPREAATLKLSVDGQPVDIRVQPGDLGGHWLEISSVIPGNLIKTPSTSLRIDVADGVYMPYYHWFYQGNYMPDSVRKLPEVNAHFDPGITLLGAQITTDAANHAVYVDTEWLPEPGQDRGDDKVFVHLYKDTAQPPVAQYDNRPGGGAIPPANWLPGIFRERYTIPLPTEPGTYPLAIGMYNERTGQRLPIIDAGTAKADADQRLFIGTVTVTP